MKGITASIVLLLVFNIWGMEYAEWKQMKATSAQRAQEYANSKAGRISGQAIKGAASYAVGALVTGVAGGVAGAAAAAATSEALEPYTKGMAASVHQFFEDMGTDMAYIDDW